MHKLLLSLTFLPLLTFSIENTFENATFLGKIDPKVLNFYQNIFKTNRCSWELVETPDGEVSFANICPSNMTHKEYIALVAKLNNPAQEDAKEESKNSAEPATINEESPNKE